MKEIEVANRAQEVIEELSRNKSLLTTSQIRKFLTAVNTITEKVTVYCIQNPEKADKLPEELQAEIKYLKIKLAYQIGKKANFKWNPKTQQNEDNFNPVRKFEEKAKLNAEIDSIKDSTKAYQVFAKYMEALVAFHKFYGGRD